MIRPLDILSPVGTITVRPAMSFITHKFFKINTSHDGLVKISQVEDNFKSWFIPQQSIENELVLGNSPYRVLGIRNGISEVVLNYYTLNNDSVCAEDVFDQFGDETNTEVNVETFLAEIAACMQKQANGEDGALLTNRKGNIFYVCDVSGVLRVVTLFWHRGGFDGRWYYAGWGVYANSVDGLPNLRAGVRVFSCDS